MSQFDVYQNPNANSRKAYPYLLDVQHEVIDELSTRLVIPLGRLRDFQNEQMKILSPIVEHDGEQLVLLTSQLTSMPVRLLKRPIGSLSALRSEVVAAIGFAITGFQETKTSNTSAYQGMPLQLQGFLSAVDSFGGMTSQDIAEFKKYSEVFKNEFSL